MLGLFNRRRSSKEKELVGEHSLPMLSLVVRGTSAGV
jgi:hypothetical protein